MFFVVLNIYEKVALVTKNWFKKQKENTESTTPRCFLAILVVIPGVNSSIWQYRCLFCCDFFEFLISHQNVYNWIGINPSLV